MIKGFILQNGFIVNEDISIKTINEVLKVIKKSFQRKLKHTKVIEQY